MKKITAIILALLVLLGGGYLVMQGDFFAAPEPTPSPTPTPIPVEWEEGLARASYGEAIYEILDLGTDVTVIGQIDEYYVIKGEEVNLLIDKRFLRLNLEEPFEAKDGYAKSKTAVYANGYMDEESIATLKENTKITVLDGKEEWLRIEWEGGYGYINAAQYSKNRIVHYSGSGGGGGGGPQDGSDVSLGALSAETTEAVVELLPVYFGPVMEELGELKAVTLTHETRAYLYLYDRDEIAKVTKVGEETCEVYMDGWFAEIPRWLVYMEEDTPYESWTGYAKSKAQTYSKYQMRDAYALEKLKQNTELLVVDELPTCYVVEMNGEYVYMKLDDISKKRIVNYSGGGGGTGGGGGGGEWTPPAM